MKPAQKNHDLKHKLYDEFSRVTESITKHGRDYLPESFDLNLYQNPEFRPCNKSKFKTLKGFDTHSGNHSAHVGYQHPG